MEELIRNELERFGVPGAAVAVIRDGQIELADGFGIRNIERKQPVSARTLFPIGSTTKALTATVLGSLVDDGLLQWDRPVRDYLPDFQLSDPIAALEITLRDMLSHRTGLPRHDMLMFMSGGGELTRAELVQRLRYLQLNRRPRQEWQYNNLIYMTAGYLVEVVAGMTWEEAVHKRLLDPLGMTNTNFSLVESQKSDDHSAPHSEREGTLVEVPFRSIEAIGPAGSINSCIEDMAQWLLLNVNGGQIGDKKVVSAGAMREIHEPAIVLSGGSWWEEATATSYALGWVVQEHRGHRLLWHNGGLDGFKAMVAFVPKKKLGVCVLANRFPSDAPEALAFRICDALLGLEPIDWGERYHELEGTMHAAAEEAKTHSRSKAKGAGPTHPLEDYAGDYSHPGYGRVGFSIEDDNLAADFRGARVTLEHRHYDIWDAREWAHDIHIPVSFQMDLDGDIGSVAITLEPAVDPIVFVREPDAELLDPEVLDRLVGSYTLGPLSITVERVDQTLKATLPGDSVVELMPLRNFRFAIKDQVGVVAEFIRDDAGTVNELAIEGAGIFRRSKS